MEYDSICKEMEVDQSDCAKRRSKALLHSCWKCDPEVEQGSEEILTSITISLDDYTEECKTVHYMLDGWMVAVQVYNKC